MPRGRPKKVTPVHDTPKKEEVAKIHCLRCGNSTMTNFYMSRDKHKQFFGKVPYCKECIKRIYTYYSGMYDDQNLAVYYTCRKIDVPYIHSNYLGAVENIKNPNSKIHGEGAIMQAYMKGFSFAEQNGWGTSFDDSQGENQIEKLNTFDAVTEIKRNRINNPTQHNTDDSDEYETIEYDTEFLQSKWGMTFENWELAYLESEYLDWNEKLNGINDKTLDILVKQICYQLLDIYKDRQSGAAVDKKLKTLTDLMNNSGLIDKQDKANEKHQTLGMEIERIEYMKPATSGKPIFDDVDGTYAFSNYQTDDLFALTDEEYTIGIKIEKGKYLVANLMTDTDIEMSSVAKSLGVIKAQSAQKFDDINGLILTIPVSYGRKALKDNDIHVVDDISVVKKRYIKFYRL